MSIFRSLAFYLPIFALACGSEKPVDSGGGGSTEVIDGAEVYANDCAGCHGSDGEGAATNPSLVDGVPLLSDEELMDILLNPQGAMAIVSLTQAEADAVFGYVRVHFGEFGGTR
jgi:mono/diheme cytochrome c family protein